MNIQVSDAALFRRSIDALKDFLPHAQIHVTATEGLTIRGMDAGHIAFFDYFLSAKDCEVYQVPEECMLGVATASLSKVLAMSASADALIITHDDDHLRISFTGDGRSGSFELPLVVIDEDTLDIPETSYKATVRARSSDIASVLKDLALLGEKAVLSLDEDGFHVRAEGDVGKGEFVLEPTDDREMLMEGDEVEEVSFAMKFIYAIVKNCAALSATIEVAFDAAQPMRITVKFGRGSHFVAFLAPKVAED